MNRVFLVTLLLGLLNSCTSSDEVPKTTSFPIYPAAAVLKPGEKVNFRTPYDHYAVSLSQDLGSLTGDTTYTAPDTINENSKIELTFEANGMKAVMPIFLLSPSARKAWYNGDWKEHRLPGQILEANVWGANKSNTKDLSLNITAFKIDGIQYLGWEWWVNSEDRTTIKCYPEIVYGWKPWRGQSTNESLPQQLKEIKKIDIKFEAIGKGEGSHNLAFDCWVTEGELINVNTIKAEIMVWEDWHGMRPIGEKVEILNTPFGDYEFWTGTTQDWDYHAFRRVLPRSKGYLETAWFFKFLTDRGYLSKEDTLASIEFGNEVATGKGITILRDYSVDVR